MKPVLIVLRTLAVFICTAVIQVYGSSSPEEVEAQLLSYLGMKRRPKPSNIVVPEFMIKMYEKQSGLEYETTNFPSPGKLTGSANTLRSLSSVNKISDSVDDTKARTFFRFEKVEWENMSWRQCTDSGSTVMFKCTTQSKGRRRPSERRSYATRL